MLYQRIIEGGTINEPEGVPMVYVSHDPSEMRQLATQIVMLKRGRVTAFGGPEVLPEVVRTA